MMRMTAEEYEALFWRTFPHPLDCDCDDCDDLAEEDLQRRLDLILLSKLRPPTNAVH